MVWEEEAYDWGVGVGRGKYFERSGRKTVERLIEYKWLGEEGQEAFGWGEGRGTYFERRGRKTMERLISLHIFFIC